MCGKFIRICLSAEELQEFSLSELYVQNFILFVSNFLTWNLFSNKAETHELDDINVCLMQGTGYVYNTVLRPYVSSHENDIEKKFREWRARAWDLAIFYWKNCTELGQATTFQILDYLAAQSKKFSSKSYSEVNFPFQ